MTGAVPKYDIKKGMSLYDGYGGNRSQSGLMEDVKSYNLKKENQQYKKSHLIQVMLPLEESEEKSIFKRQLFYD